MMMMMVMMVVMMAVALLALAFRRTGALPNGRDPFRHQARRTLFLVVMMVAVMAHGINLLSVYQDIRPRG